MKAIFGLRFQIIFWNNFISIRYIFFGILDIINFTTAILTTVMLIITITLEIYIWILIIIIWIDQKSNNMSQEYSNLSLPLRIFWIIFTVGTLVIAIYGGIIYSLSVIIRPSTFVLNILLVIMVSIMLIFLIHMNSFFLLYRDLLYIHKKLEISQEFEVPK